MNFIGVIVAISAVAMLGALATPSITRLVSKEKVYSTLLKEREVASGVEEWYRKNSYVIDSASDGDSLSFGTEVLYLPKSTDSIQKHYTPATKSLIPVFSLASGTGYCAGASFPELDTEKEDVYLDSWRRCFLLYVTEKKTSPDGIMYRNFVVVSAGEDGKVDFDSSSVGDDVVKIVSGYKIEKELYDQTLQKLEKIKESLENYFYALYLNDPTRDAGIDYFMRRKTDGSDEVNATIIDNSCLVAGEDPTTDDCLVPLSQIAYDADGEGNPDTDQLLDYLGLTSNDLNDAWGNPIFIDTASSHVRSPETDKTAPFTCRLVANTPWGDKVEVIVRQRL